MSVECGYCGNKIHDENCPKYPYCQGCKKGRGRSDHETECIYAYTLPKQRASRSKEWFRSKIDLEQGETVSAGSLTELDLEQIKEDMYKLARITIKPWGHEKIIHSDSRCVVKQIFVKKGHRLSLQYHKEKIETMFLVDGLGYITKGDHEGITFRLNHLIPVLIEPGVVHRLSADPSEDCLVLEVSSTELEDIIRIKDEYGRA